MIVTLLLLIVFILLFGAGVVKGWLANIFGYGIGGFILIVIALKLASYMGEYGILWVFAILAGTFGLAALVEDCVRRRALRKELDRIRDGTPEQRRSLAANAIWTRYVDDIRERFNPMAQNRARALYGSHDAVGLERFCRAEIDRLNQQKAE